jgi:GH15 family glucan-1,4-alpha-glucosidase
MVHGFYLASSNGNKEARNFLEDFAQVLSRDNFSFPEFYHGRDCTPMGVAPLGFSAAGYLIAYNSITGGLKPFGDII